MAETYNGGITVTFPSAGEVNWTAVFREFARTLSDHDHTGGGRGTKISGSALEIDAFTGDSFRLDFNQWLRSRNDLNTADINMIRITTDNEMEIGPVVRGGVFFIDVLRVNASAGPYNAIIQNNFDNGVGLNLVAGIGMLGFRLDSNVVSGDAIYTDYFNQGLLAFRERVNVLGEKTFSPGGIDKYRMTNLAFEPTSSDAFDLGAGGFYFANGFISTVYTSNINASTSFNLRIGGVTYWTVDGTGNIAPGANGTQDLGGVSTYLRTVRTINIYGNTKLDLGVDETDWIVIGATGTMVPYSLTQDLGSPSNTWRDGYFNGTVTAPTLATSVISGLTTINGLPYAPVWLAWTPTIGTSSGDHSSTTITSARYSIRGKTLDFMIRFNVLMGGGTYNTVSITMPAPMVGGWGPAFSVNSTSSEQLIGRWIATSSTTVLGAFFEDDGATNVRVYSATMGTGDGNVIFFMSGSVELI